jgi:hypothetical protein
MTLVLRAAFVAVGVVFAVPAAAGDYLNSDSPHAMAMRNLPFGRAFDDSTSGRINMAPRVPMPHIITKAEWGGGEATTSLLRAHLPTRLTLHHGGVRVNPAADHVKALRGLQRYGWNEKNWPDLPYHFVIEPDGLIYEGRDPLKVGDTNTSYDPTGHLLVCVSGNYEDQTVNEKQLAAICDLYAWLSDRYNINPETLGGHMEYAETLCPGRNLQALLVSGLLEGEIRRRLRSAYGLTGEPKPTASAKTAVGTQATTRTK